jgi:hypothetical protein
MILGVGKRFEIGDYPCDIFKNDRIIKRYIQTKKTSKREGYVLIVDAGFAAILQLQTENFVINSVHAATPKI